MIAALLAVTFTFTATATGVEKGMPVEFVFAGRNSDRDYESMFLLDGSIDDFCAGLEKAGVPRGCPTDPTACRLWPVGCRLEFKPALETYVTGFQGLEPIYTGGTRLGNGLCEASTNMPASLFSTYTLAQSPIVGNGSFDQGAVYGSFTAARQLKKGDKVEFTVTADPQTLPHRLAVTVTPGRSLELLKRIKSESEKGPVDLLVGFDGNLSVSEATAVANALASIDSPAIKINGCSNIFYRSFLPLVKWLDRKERLVQPFELTLGDPDRIVFIEEDWSVEGNDPKLTPKEISFGDALKNQKVDTCFIYANKDTSISRILSSMNKLKGGKVANWYVFARD